MMSLHKLSMPTVPPTVSWLNRVRAVTVNEMGIWMLQLKSCEEKDWFAWYQEWLVLVISLEGSHNKALNAVFRRRTGVEVLQPMLSSSIEQPVDHQQMA